MKAFFIYLLTDPKNVNKGYVGATDNPARRFRDHLYTKETCYRGNWIRALKKRGLKPELEILAQVPESTWPQDEIDYIAAFRAMGFDLVNTTVGGDNPPPFKGKKHSYKARAKISAAHSANPNSGTFKLGQIPWNTGKKFPPESNPNFGKPMLAAQKAKISAALSGRKLSLETRKKMSVSRSGKKRGPYRNKVIGRL